MNFSKLESETSTDTTLRFFEAVYEHDKKCAKAHETSDVKVFPDVEMVLGLNNTKIKCPKCTDGYLKRDLIQDRSGDEGMSMHVRCTSCEFSAIHK